MERHQLILMRQRAAVVRAIARAREARADEDAEILESVVHLLEEFHKLVPRAFTKH
jgi:hypothetical protein